MASRSLQSTPPVGQAGCSRRSVANLPSLRWRPRGAILESQETRCRSSPGRLRSDSGQGARRGPRRATRPRPSSRRSRRNRVSLPHTQRPAAESSVAHRARESNEAGRRLGSASGPRVVTPQGGPPGVHMVAARSLNLRRAMIEGLGNAPRTASSRRSRRLKLTEARRGVGWFGLAKIQTEFRRRATRRRSRSRQFRHQANGRRRRE